MINTTPMFEKCSKDGLDYVRPLPITHRDYQLREWAIKTARWIDKILFGV